MSNREGHSELVSESKLAIAYSVSLLVRGKRSLKLNSIANRYYSNNFAENFLFKRILFRERRK